MKYTTEIIIEKPLQEVVNKMHSTENMKHWQEGFISFEHLAGEAGTEGATSLLKYKMGKREMEMKETIIKHDLPAEFSARYEAKGVWNEVYNYFTVVDKNTTVWESEVIFKFKGFMKIIAFLMPGSFKKQTYKFMQAFKKFAEQS